MQAGIGKEIVVGGTPLRPVMDILSAGSAEEALRRVESGALVPGDVPAALHSGRGAEMPLSLRQEGSKILLSAPGYGVVGTVGASELAGILRQAAESLQAEGGPRP